MGGRAKPGNDGVSATVAPLSAVPAPPASAVQSIAAMLSGGRFREPHNGCRRRTQADVTPPRSPAVRPHHGPRRQVDQPPRPDVRRSRGGRDAHHRPARGRGRAAHRRRHAGARRRSDARPRRNLARRRPRHRRTAGTGGRAGHGQLRHRRAPAVRHPGEPSAVRGDDRRRQPAPAADAPGDRPALGLRRALLVARGRPPAARRPGSHRGAAARLPRAGAVRAGEVGGAAVRAERTRHHPRRGTRGDARPQREHAAPFRRQRAGGGGRTPAHHHVAGPAGTARRRCRRAGRSPRPRPSWLPRRSWSPARG